MYCICLFCTDSIGRGEKTLCNGPKVLWHDDNTTQTSVNNEIDTSQTPRPTKDSVIKDTNQNFKFPNMWLNHVSDKIQILAFFISVEDEHSIIELRFYNKNTGKRTIDKSNIWLVSRANKVVERQDKSTVITHRPKASGLFIDETLVQVDKPIMKYCKRSVALQEQK